MVKVDSETRTYRVAESRTTSRLSFLTLVAVYSRTTLTERKNNSV